MLNNYFSQLHFKGMLYLCKKTKKQKNNFHVSHVKGVMLSVVHEIDLVCKLKACYESSSRPIVLQSLEVQSKISQ